MKYVDRIKQKETLVKSEEEDKAMIEELRKKLMIAKLNQIIKDNQIKERKNAKNA
jgi:hypothetical protein